MCAEREKSEVAKFGMPVKIQNVETVDLLHIYICTLFYALCMCSQSFKA